MITSVSEIISMLPPKSATETDLEIERFDEWHNAQDVAPTTTCLCG